MIQNREMQTTRFTKRLLARKHKQSRTRRVLVAGLMLTSMVDMFSLLVIFLLQSFSNSPEVMTLTKGLTLPASISASAVIDAPVLMVTEAQVLLDQREVGSLTEILTNPARLSAPLKALVDKWKSSHPGADFKGEINLQADRGMPSTAVARVMNILNGHGYGAVHLAVVGSNSAPAEATP